MRRRMKSRTVARRNLGVGANVEENDGRRTLARANPPSGRTRASARPAGERPGASSSIALQASLHQFAIAGEHGVGQRLLVREELVQRADRRRGAGGDLGHGRAIETLFGENRGSGLEERSHALAAAIALRRAGRRGEI